MPSGCIIALAGTRKVLGLECSMNSGWGNEAEAPVERTSTQMDSKPDNYDMKYSTCSDPSEIWKSPRMLCCGNITNVFEEGGCTQQ